MPNSLISPSVGDSCGHNNIFCMTGLNVPLRYPIQLNSRFSNRVFELNSNIANCHSYTSSLLCLLIIKQSSSESSLQYWKVTSRSHSKLLSLWSPAIRYAEYLSKRLSELSCVLRRELKEVLDLRTANLPLNELMTMLHAVLLQKASWQCQSNSQQINAHCGSTRNGVRDSQRSSKHIWPSTRPGSCYLTRWACSNRLVFKILTLNVSRYIYSHSCMAWFHVERGIVP